MVTPLLNIWSGYSVLRSTWRFEPGLSALARLGYRQVGLADWETLAGAEIFEREAKNRGLTPWIGVTLNVQMESDFHPLRLYAMTSEGWQHLCGLMEATEPHTVTSVQSPHVMAIWAKDSPRAPVLWSGLRDYRFSAVIEEMWPPGEEGGQAPTGWWLPAWPIRWHDPADDDAYRALVQIGGHDVRTLPLLQPLPPASELLSRYPFAWRNRVFQGEAPATVLPNRDFKLPRSKESVDQERQTLETLVDQGLDHKFSHLTPEIMERRNHELEIIGSLGFSGYFLIVADLVQFARKSNIKVGPGRGSAAGSLVSYALGITDVDPLAHGLIFERFLNPARKSMPDIDLDFDYERRYELIEYLRGRWGADRVAQIGTFGTLGARAVTRDVGRVLGIAPQLVDHVAASLAPGLDVAAVADQMNKIDESGRWSQLSQKLEGLPRHASIHAAGVIVAPEPIRNWVPCHRDEGYLVTQMEMASLERLGLLKLDLLGLRTLTVIQQVEQATGTTGRSLATLDPCDGKTLRLLGRGDTEAVFQLDGAGVVELLRALRPQSMEDVMTVVALYRPGPMDNISRFLTRRRQWQASEDDALGRLIPETYGILVYQEQLMMVIRELAGYTWAEADLFRRAISKKDRALLDSERNRLVGALERRGMDQNSVQELWRQITAFADYGFNKSHAAAYGSLSYYVAYLKAHHPLEFWAAELSTLADLGRLQKTVDIIAASGIEFYPPDINRSGVRYLADTDRIRVGLAAVRGVSRETAGIIVRERENQGPYRNWDDFISRVGRQLGDRVCEALDDAEVFADIAGGRRKTTQISWFEDRKDDGSLVRGRFDAQSILGWRWPVAVGPIYVRIDAQSQWESIAQRVSIAAKGWPGPEPIVLARPEGRGRSIQGITMAAHWKALATLREIDGVLAAGRQIEKLTEVPR